MAALSMYQVDAFADRPFSGNPAAVLVLDRPLDERRMQAIAAENNLSETAFVARDDGAYLIRWFTPSHEAAFCGHATLAAAHVLRTEYGLSLPVRFCTLQVGDLVVDLGAEGLYALDLPRLDPQPFDPPALFDRLFPKGRIAAFRNFENCFVELGAPDDVADYVPDLPAIATLGPIGLCITARGGRTHRGQPADFVSRYFWPGGGIDEDPATGSTHSTLVPYWAAKLGRPTLSAFQASRRGGEMTCRLTDDRVILGAQAVTFLQGLIFPG